MSCRQDFPSANVAELRFNEQNGLTITPVDNFEWQTFQHELIAYNADLLFLPERHFLFQLPAAPDVTLVLPQAMDDVGTTIWDAETVLAHYIDTAFFSTSTDQTASGNVDSGSAAVRRPRSVLELGAGTGLAALLCERRGVQVVVAQETEEVMPKLQQLLVEQGSRVIPVAGLWGQDLVRAVQAHPTLVQQLQGRGGAVTDGSGASRADTDAAIVQPSAESTLAVVSTTASSVPTPQSAATLGAATSQTASPPHLISAQDQAPTPLPAPAPTPTPAIHYPLSEPTLPPVQFDCILMADVFYHPEHFPALRSTVHALLRPGGQLLVAFEQRRRDLSGIVMQLAGTFQQRRVLRYTVPAQCEGGGEEGGADGGVDAVGRVTTLYVCHFEGFQMGGDCESAVTISV